MKRFVVLLAAACISASTYGSIESFKTKRKKMFFNDNIYTMTLDNTNFRKEIVTGPHSQVVLMSVPVGGEIGKERHTVDQTLIFVQGEGRAILNGQSSNISVNHLVFVPAGTEHNFINTGKNELKLFTIYAPAEHKAGTLEKTKR